ncbi:hypothetical protein E2320_018302 [Naja naja]|nr:hypothetical protein E2320_018302 [Naja naja]
MDPLKLFPVDSCSFQGNTSIFFILIEGHITNFDGHLKLCPRVWMLHLYLCRDHDTLNLMWSLPTMAVCKRHSSHAEDLVVLPRKKRGWRSAVEGCLKVFRSLCWHSGQPHRAVLIDLDPLLHPSILKKWANLKHGPCAAFVQEAKVNIIDVWKLKSAHPLPNILRNYGTRTVLLVCNTEGGLKRRGEIACLNVLMAILMDGCFSFHYASIGNNKMFK